MALNAKSAPMGGGGNFTLMEPGTYPARLVGIVDLGLQPQSYAGEEKAPKQEIALTYEMSDAFMTDEDGQELTDKPRWLTESMPLNNLESEKAKSTARYKALDPTGAFEGDFTKTIGTPINVTVVHNPGKGKNTGKTFENVASIAPMRTKDQEKCAALVNEPYVFDLDEPDMAVFIRLPKFLQERIKNNLEFAGSKMAEMLKTAGEVAPPKQAQKTSEKDRPW